MRTTPLPACACALALLLLGGCAGYAPRAVVAGQTEAEVRRSMGVPTGRHALPGGGSRLEYARGPYGRETYMVDLDAAGRVTGWQQVLHEASFLRIVPGMTREELLRTIGRPGEVYALPRVDAQVWSWRYPTNDCLWFQATVTRAGHVRDAGYGIDRRCDGPPERW